MPGDKAQRKVIRPIPCDPYEVDEYLESRKGREPWLDYNLFIPEVLEGVIELNFNWLKSKPFKAICALRVLFPWYEQRTMTQTEVMVALWTPCPSPALASPGYSWPDSIDLLLPHLVDQAHALLPDEARVILSPAAVDGGNLW